MPGVKRVEPAYLQIANWYLKQVERGKLREGDRIDSVHKIAEDWGVAKQTAANAMQHLQRAGYLESTPGRGSFIRMPEED